MIYELCYKILYFPLSWSLYILGVTKIYAYIYCVVNPKYEYIYIYICRDIIEFRVGFRIFERMLFFFLLSQHLMFVCTILGEWYGNFVVYISKGCVYFVVCPVSFVDDVRLVCLAIDRVTRNS